MTRSRRPAAVRRLFGFSLIELMVGVTIGLIGVTVIAQIYAVSEDRKRSATGSSDAQVAGNISIFSMERAIRMSGYGLSSTRLLECTTLAHNNTRATPDFNFVIRPVWIEQGAAGASDQITVMYSGSGGVSAIEGSPLNGSAASGANFPMQSVAGYIANDLVIVAETGQNCTLAEVSSIPAGTNEIAHAGGTYNKVGGLGVAYTSAAYLFKVGSKAYDSTKPNLTPFNVLRFRVVNDVLRMESLIPYTVGSDTEPDGYTDFPIATGVVQLQALYGKDNGTDTGHFTNAVYAADDNMLDGYDVTTPTTAAAWRQTQVIRVALLVRIGKWEKTAVTTVAPTWAGGNFVMSTLADGTAWQNYRYRVYEVDIPIRNMIWVPA